MKLYRYSPVTSESVLREAIDYLHMESMKLCKRSLWRYLPNAWNVWFFCHFPEEYQHLTTLRESLTESSENMYQKYFKLQCPYVFNAKWGMPETTYSYLYIRKPDPYRFHVGDIDFYLPDDEYKILKQDLIDNGERPGMRAFPREDLDMIELYDRDSDVLAYVSTESMTKKARVKVVNS